MGQREKEIIIKSEIPFGHPSKRIALTILIQKPGAQKRGPNTSVQFSSVAQFRLTLCDPMDCSMPGFPAHHQLLEFAQAHVHRVGDAIQVSHPLSSPSSPRERMSQIRLI